MGSPERWPPRVGWSPELERFYRSFFLPLVRRVVRRHGLSAEDAGDIVQDAFVLAVEKIDPDRNPKAWLYQVVDHLALNWQRKTLRRARLMAYWSSATGRRRAHGVPDSRDHEVVRSVGKWVQVTQRSGWRGFAEQNVVRALERTQDEELAELSALGFTLLNKPFPSGETLREASSAFERLRGSIATAADVDEFGEVPEIVRFAFVAWRHARSIGKIREGQRWLETLDRELEAASALSESLKYFLLSGPDESPR